MKRPTLEPHRSEGGPMDLRRLSYFVLACQEQSCAATAAKFRITQSTFSEALKLLTEETGAPLLEQVQRRMHPTPTGLWLFRSALPLLHAEEFFRNWVAQGPSEQKPAHLAVHVKASFGISRLTKAVSRAIQIFGQAHPHIFLEPCFVDPESTVDDAHSIAGAFGQDDRSLLIIEAAPYSERPLNNPATTLALAQDAWIVMRAARGGQPDRSPSSMGARYIAPALGRSLVQQLRDAAGRAKIDVEFCEEAAGNLPRLILQQPDAAYLLPGYLVADRHRLANIDVRPFWPPLTAKLVARHHEGDAAAREFAEIVRNLLEPAGELGSPEENVCFRPVLSYRQMRYSRALFESGTITAAARSLSMAQPALTDVLQKLEQALDSRFFHRSREGLIPTEAGQRLDAAAKVILEGARRIAVESASVVCAEGGRLKIGVVPAAAHTSAMPQCIARAIWLWRKRFPSIRIQVLQGSTGALQTMVSNGTIALAITERTVPGMARFKLADAEPLSLIANPRFNLLPPGPVLLADLMNLPLAVPTQEVGLRQILDAAVLDAHLKFTPVMEVNSIPLTLAMVREQPLCTVLPASAVQNQINSGALRSHMIIEPTLTRQFYAFHSGQRDLNKSEREFLELLRLEFMRADNNFDVVPVAAKRL